MSDGGFGGVYSLATLLSAIVMVWSGTLVGKVDLKCFSILKNIPGSGFPTFAFENVKLCQRTEITGGGIMIEIACIDHIVLRTTKAEEMLEFYCDVLGCSVERETSDDTGLIQLRAGNALIDLVKVDSELGRSGGGPPTETENNLDHFCLQLKPVSETEIANHLSRHGIEKGSFHDRYGAQGVGKSIYISDPEGNTVELRSQI